MVPPIAATRSLSFAFPVLWSTVSALVSPRTHAHARESPRLATVSAPLRSISTVAVEPVSSVAGPYERSSWSTWESKRRENSCKGFFFLEGGDFWLLENYFTR